MSRDVTRAGGGVIVVPRISPQLRRLLNHREVVAGYGGDAGTSGGGDFRRGPWVRPEWVDIRERDEAQQALPAFEHLAGPVPEQTIIDFLNFLWISTRHSADQTFEGVCMVYPRMLRQFPAYCWRPEKLDLAPHAFPTFFPTVGEIAAFLQPDKTWIEEEIVGLRGVAEADVNPNAAAGPGGPKRPWAQGGMEDHQAWLAERDDRQRRADFELLRERDAAQGVFAPEEPPPIRQPGEDDKAWVSRLMAFTRRQIDHGARGRKRDEEYQKAIKSGAIGPTTEQVQQAQKAFEEDHPPPPEAGKAGKADNGLTSPEDP
jgi:hypothetical protein